MTSATAMPTATPTVSSIARTVRPPRETPIAMTAEAGAKNELGVQQRGQRPRAAGGHCRLQDPPEVAAHAPHPAAQRTAQLRHRRRDRGAG
jgi:hypothetical protein